MQMYLWKELIQLLCYGGTNLFDNFTPILNWIGLMGWNLWIHHKHLPFLSLLLYLVHPSCDLCAIVTISFPSFHWHFAFIHVPFLWCKNKYNNLSLFSHANIFSIKFYWSTVIKDLHKYYIGMNFKKNEKCCKKLYLVILIGNFTNVLLKTIIIVNKNKSQYYMTILRKWWSVKLWRIMPNFSLEIQLRLRDAGWLSILIIVKTHT